MDAMDVDSQSHEGENTPTVLSTASRQTSRPNNVLSKLIESSSESEHEKVPEQPVRAKLVARLQPQMDTDTSDSDDNEDDENAYERVKRMLMSGSDKAKPDPEVIPKDKATEIASEDDEDMPVRTNNARRQVLLREKSRTPPMSSPRRMISRASSPGLFVTPDASPVPQKVSRISPAAEDGAPPTKPRHDKDLEERVKRIRAERLAAKEEKRKQERSKKPARITANSGSDSDGESGRRLTQQARPTRRAGKKALEDIAREQQRISRNMQLTHQAKTKKKYGIKDLLPRFGLAQVGSELVSAPAIPTPDASSVVASSDAEAAPEHHTPPTSPPRQEDATLGLEPSASPQLLRQDKGKGRAPESQHVPSNPLVQQTMLAVQKERASARKSVPTEMIELSDSDDDLKVEKPQSRFAVFDKVPQRKQREPSSLLALRHLAHLTSPGKRAPKGRKTMSMAELYSKLGRKAREQAQKERDEKIEELRRRGIHIETEEERERHQLEIEDLVAQLEKTREEDLKLAKLEKEEAKKNGEKRDDLLSSDESEDEDYVGSGEEETVELETEEQVEIELSGSEEEDLAEADDEEEPDEEEEEEQENTNGLLDDAAEESADEEDLETQERKQQEPEEEVDDESPHARVHNRTANRARKVVLDESEESGDESQNKSAPVEAVPLPSQTQAEDPMAAFGFENSSPGLGLTQMFAGTMANLVTGSQQKHALDDAPEQDSLDFLRSLPDTQPGNVPESPSDLLVPNSQMLAYQQDESQISLGVSQLVRSSPAFAQTQLVEEFEPTQDAGFELPRSPAGLAVPPSTVETVMMTVAESPVKKTKGKLHRRKHMANAELSDVDDTPASGSEAEAEKVMEAADAGNAFTVLKKAAKRQKRAEDNFDKKNSLARNAIEEQAEESEDEYAGIGGASDEDSGEEDEELAQMIDTNEVKVDERKIAAYFAEKAKADDEKNINQLYKDIMNGGLRKRRGGDAFDVSDSEDEVEQRRRKRRMEFQKMTKALISDERIGKIAQNPKQAAFFHTLADHFEDPEYEFLDAPEMDVDGEASQSQSDEAKEGEISVPDSQTVDAAAPINPLKRKSTDSQEKENRPPPHMRRTVLPDNMSRKPMTLADVQHSVQELLDDNRIVVPDSQYSDSDSELEIVPSETTSRKPIIDRLSMSRTASNSESAVDSNLAFVAPAAGVHQPGFRVPSLVRRATSNLSAVSTSTSGVSTPVEGTVVRRGGTGRSNIHAQAREAERRAALEKVEKKRKETLKKKVGKARGQRSVLRCLDGGFE